MENLFMVLIWMQNLRKDTLKIIHNALNKGFSVKIVCGPIWQLYMNILNVQIIILTQTGGPVTFTLT